MFKSYSQKVFGLILIAACLKMIAAPFLELGNDEVYYWTYALQIDFNHFDHPPLVGFLIRASTLNMQWVSELSMRLGAIISASLGCYFVFKTTTVLANERAGFYAAILYQAGVYTGFIAGFFILPDSAQLIFWTASLYVMSLLLFGNKEKQIVYWIILGLLIGFATLSKVHGLFLWAGFGAYLLCTNYKRLFSFGFILAIGVTLFCTLPIVYWNVIYDFITYRFHSERVTHTGIDVSSFATEIIGEVLYQNPFVYILMLAAVVGFKKVSFQQNNSGRWLLWMSLPLIFIFWTVALFNPTLPHWSGPAFIPLMIIAGIYLDQKKQNWPLHVLRTSVVVVFTILLALVVIVQKYPGNFGSQKNENLGEYCPTLDLSGWKDFSAAFKTIAAQDQSNHMMGKAPSIIVGKWFPAGHLEFYTSRTTGLSLIGIGPLQDIHKFAWLNKQRPALTLGTDAYCIVPSNVPFNVTEAYGQYFKLIDAPVIIDQKRSGVVVRHFLVYRLHGCIKVPQPIL
ncbi:MAG: ArnT family glycosyltransferase [Sediminibacterium sp.]